MMIFLRFCFLRRALRSLNACMSASASASTRSVGRTGMPTGWKLNGSACRGSVASLRPALRLSIGPIVDPPEKEASSCFNQRFNHTRDGTKREAFDDLLYA